MVSPLVSRCVYLIHVHTEVIYIAVNHLSVLGVVSSDHPTPPPTTPDLSNSDFLMSGSRLTPARPLQEIINVYH